MIDPVLERRLADCKQLLQLWRLFHDFFAVAVKGEDITATKEEQFLEIKSRVAMLHDSLMESLTHDQSIGQNVLAIVSRSITLKHVNRMSNAEIKKIEIEWHESFLLLNETVGLLEEKKEELEGKSAFSYNLANFRKRFSYYLNRFIHSTYTKVVLILAALAFIIWGVPAFGIYDYRDLRNYKITREPYYKLVTIYRKFIARNFVYDDFEHIDQDESKRLPNFKDHSVGDYNKTDILKLYENIPGLDIHDQLSQAEQFRFEKFTVDGRDVQVHMFLFKTADEAIAVQKKFSEWKTELPEYQKTDQNSFAFLTSVYQRANLVIFVRTQRPTSERNNFIAAEFGIKI